MAEHSFDSPSRDFAAEIELLRSANTLPALSNRLRARVLDAATSAYRQARRCAQARQAASFLSVCLLASFVLSPIATFSLPSFASPIDLASQENYSSAQQPNSAWTLRHDREFLGLPREADLKSQISNLKSKKSHSDSQLDARVEPSPPRDKLLTALHSSDGWATVQAFQAVRSRSHSTLQRAFAAN
ncbi:MAG: hypothetical protein DWI21_14895 [Planctomycetota bacterium]|nr:MAG: hypothetical protein DWI21_14895 [Planctomycetota bacterium]GDY10631.1 hypothetical protein LBMAG52_41190 [Planctomycetia bacterium]